MFEKYSKGKVKKDGCSKKRKTKNWQLGSLTKELCDCELQFPAIQEAFFNNVHTFIYSH